MKIRNYRNDDADFLKEMLLTVIYNPDKATDPKILLEPELKIYYQDFGTGVYDYAQVMTSNSGARTGMVWCRLIHGNGFFRSDIPELAIAIKEEYQGHGYGTKLLENFLKLANDHNFTGLSLSVDERNGAALEIYEKAGFQKVSQHQDMLIMSLLF